MKRILFVCMGNICRSPSAEGVARKLFETSELGGPLKLILLERTATMQANRRIRVRSARRRAEGSICPD